MTSPLQDEQARKEALNIQTSHIVQAPAGSGKTELLIQRYLKLLANVEKPERILAMTFTRKAAGEMKKRVLKALDHARNPKPPSSSHEKTTWEIARQAFKHDEQQGWRILDNPQRLKIQTIDSFCTSLTKQTPLLSGMGSLLEITENASDLYRETAHQVLAMVENESNTGLAVRAILKRLENSKARFLDHIVKLLNKRDQWMISFFENAEEYRSRDDQERILSELVESILKECYETIDQPFKTELFQLALYSGNNIAADNPDDPLACLAKLQEFPKPSADQLPFWKALVSMVLTASNTPRKKPNKTTGFPADKTDTAQDYKKRMQNILEKLEKSADVVELFVHVRTLPNPRLSNEEWEFLEHMLELLPVIDGTLRRIFSERGKIDFTEIALSSKKALGQEMAPSELLLKLDSTLHHILVDEFQDTSFKQITLLKLLTEGWEPEKGRTLFLVGDPMQSIYRFRDAEVGLFVQAKDDGLGQIPLQKLQLLANFRSQKHIVHWVNQCFSEILPSMDDPDRGAIAYNKCSAVQEASLEPGVVLHPAIDSKSDEEAHHVVQTIHDIRTHYPEDSITILVRARPHLLNIVPLLQEAGIKFRAEEIDPLTSRPAILDLLALMRALISPMDRVSWLSILRAPWCGLSLEDLHRLCLLDRTSPVWNLLNNSERLAQLSEEGRQRAKRFMAILEPALNTFPAINFRSLLEGCWIKLGGPACIDTYARKDIQVFFDKVTEVLDGGEFDSLHDFENILNNLFANPSTGEGHAVQIMTIHKAKGLEFDFVLLPGLGKKHKADEKQLINWITHGHNLLFAPIPRAGEKDSEIYAFLKRLEKDRGEFEARRLLYVAATRTKKQLHLFGHTQMTKDGIAPQSPSSLRHLWSFISDDWKKAHEKMKPQPEKICNSGNQTQFLRRLPVDFETPAAPSDLKTEPAMDISLKEEVLYEWAGVEARCLGNVLHRMFETITREGLDHWDEQRVEQGKSSLETALLAEGVSSINLDQTVQKGLRALKNTLKDQDGRKILKRYENEGSELALTYTEDRNFKTKIVDRTFIDENDVRWIIDYKTGERKGGDLEGFFQQETERYRSQLESYEKLIRLQGETRPIRKALYFPLHQRLVEILPK